MSLIDANTTEDANEAVALLVGFSVCLDAMAEAENLPPCAVAFLAASHAELVGRLRRVLAEISEESQESPLKSVA